MYDKDGNPITKNSALNNRAKELRKNMTKEECHLWFDFLSQLPIRFKRQAIIENYIVDFLCVKKRIVIELDGSQHYDNVQQISKDSERDKTLKNLGFTVLRYTNLDIQKNFNGVCEDIYRYL